GVREEGGRRGVRGPRDGGEPPARGGCVPGDRARRLPRRRPLSGRAEDLRQGGCMSVQAATRPRPPIAAPHLRTDAWWALPLTTAIVLGSFIVYSTWAAFQNAHYWAPPYLSPFYSPCLSAKCLHVTFGYRLPEAHRRRGVRHRRRHPGDVGERDPARRLHVLVPLVPARVRRSRGRVQQGADALPALALHHAAQRAASDLRVAVALQRRPHGPL